MTIKQHIFRQNSFGSGNLRPSRLLCLWSPNATFKEQAPLLKQMCSGTVTGMDLQWPIWESAIRFFKYSNQLSLNVYLAADSSLYLEVWQRWVHYVLWGTGICFRVIHFRLASCFVRPIGKKNIFKNRQNSRQGGAWCYVKRCEDFKPCSLVGRILASFVECRCDCKEHHLQSLDHVRALGTGPRKPSCNMSCQSNCLILSHTNMYIFVRLIFQRSLDQGHTERLQSMSDVIGIRQLAGEGAI